MDEKKASVQKPADEDFLELNEELLPADSDSEDIITLLDETPPDGAKPSTDPEIRALRERFSAMTEADDGADLLELLDDVVSTDASPAEGEDEDVLELSEEVSGGGEDACAGRLQNAEQDETDVHDLLMLLEEDDSDPGGFFPSENPGGSVRAKDLLENGFELGEALDAAIDREVSAENAVRAGSRAMKLEFVPDANDMAAPEISDTRLTDALERIIERRLGEKMEQLLAVAIEKVVKNEIKRLKQLLLNNSFDTD